MPPARELLNAAWMPSRALSTVASWSGSLTSQPRCGSRRMRAPLAPPRLSLPRNDAAEAHAVETSWETDSPESRIWRLRAATSSASTSSCVTAGSGSCQSRLSVGTSGPRYRATGPMSRCVSLNHARAKASANSSGFSRKRREIFSYAGSRRSDRSVVSIVGGRFGESSAGPGMVPAPAPSFACHWCAPAGLLVSSHS